MGRKNRNASHININSSMIMPLTGPYGGLDLKDTYEYSAIPESPDNAVEGHENIKDKNTKNTQL